MIERRAFLTGLISLVAAPAIVRAGSLMPVKNMSAIDDWRYLVSISTVDVTKVYGRSPAMEVLDLLSRIDAAFVRDPAIRLLHEKCVALLARP